jgi:hypothetical protein
MSSDSDPTQYKVGRIIDRYDLDGLGQELEDRWLGRGYESQSLRSLADWFNKYLLEEKFNQVGELPISGEVDNLYRLLTEDEVTSGGRLDAETVLEKKDIDPENIRQEFVSHQSVYIYLTEYQDASKHRSSEDRIESARDTIQRLQNRLIAVIENHIEQLRNTEKLTIGEFTVLVDVQILCEDCGSSYSITKLFDRGGCNCE